MDNIKKVPFDYKYFKNNPKTKLVTREGNEAIFLAETTLCQDESHKLLFDTKTESIPTNIDGRFIDDDSSIFDIFMLIGNKEEKTIKQDLEELLESINKNIELSKIHLQEYIEEKDYAWALSTDIKLLSLITFKEELDDILSKY